MTRDVSKKAPAAVLEQVPLRDGYSVTGDLFFGVLRRVEDILPALLPEVAYTTEQLCGPDFWAQLQPGDPSRAGRCLAHLVDQGLMPLVEVPTRHEYPKRYRLK